MSPRQRIAPAPRCPAITGSQTVGKLRAAWLLALGVCLCASVAWAAPAPLEIQLLDPAITDPTPDAVAGGSLDERFGPFDLQEARRSGRPFWLRVRALENATPGAIATLNV